ncbi:hypothetical protein Adeh_3865 [Anaeromyxobacter dehalogenans 2CP-C]|uniref:Uncharacterized protein n=2 Tax=Anaeromyxobacter dehalogenans TaxID=161493 RepID=Q2IGB9_ANADE|nr:hypothetical protein Adeh_3865 [Anaeromyxobacter dehalogenans 2CP-C]
MLAVAAIVSLVVGIPFGDGFRKDDALVTDLYFLAGGPYTTSVDVTHPCRSSPMCYSDAQLTRSRAPPVSGVLFGRAAPLGGPLESGRPSLMDVAILSL